MLRPGGKVGHFFAGNAAGSDPDSSLGVLRCLEDALLDEALLAERFVGEALPLSLLVLAFLSRKQRRQVSRKIMIGKATSSNITLLGQPKFAKPLCKMAQPTY